MLQHFLALFLVEVSTQLSRFIQPLCNVRTMKYHTTCLAQKQMQQSLLIVLDLLEEMVKLTKASMMQRSYQRFQVLL